MNTILRIPRILSILALCVAALSLVQPASAELIGHWISGSANLADTSGFTPAGTHDGVAAGPNAGSLAWSADKPAGFVGQSLDLTANNVGVLITNTASGDGNYQTTFDQGISNQFTVAFWFKGTLAGTWFGKSGNTPSGWKCRPLSPKADFTVRNNSGDGPSAMASANTITNDRWYHYAAVFDATSTATVRTIYLDGVLDAQVTGNYYTITHQPLSHLVIGANQDNAGNPIVSFFPGKMYDVRIYNTPLTSSEVLALAAPPVNEAIMYEFGTTGMPAVITGTNISWTVPYGTPVATLAPAYIISFGATCDKVSGSTQNFTSPVTYRVVSADTTVTNIYTVTVTMIPAGTGKEILTFGIPGYPGVITGTNIALAVPYGTDETNLAPTYTVSEFATGSPASGTIRNFTTPQTYTVVAQDLSTNIYTVTVTVAPISAAKDMLTFGIPGSPAVISGTSIALDVPYGTDVTILAPTYTVSLLAAGAPVSGTVRDFTSPQTYTVTAQDSTTKDYLVTVTVLPAPINVSYYTDINNTMDGIASDDATARGTASQVAPLAYPGTNWNDISNAGVIGLNLLNSLGEISDVLLTTAGSVGGGWNSLVNSLVTNRLLASGLFTMEITYTNLITLTGLNTSNQYDIYIASLINNSTVPGSFKIGPTVKPIQYASGTNWAVSDNYVLFASVIPDPSGTVRVDAKSLGVTFFPVNGFQINNRGTRGLNPEAHIYSFQLPGIGSATLEGTNILMPVPFGTDRTALSPTYVASVGATVDKASDSTHDFSGPVPYTVVSEDLSTTNTFIVNVTFMTLASKNIDVTVTATGSDILNDGVLVTANRFGGSNNFVFTVEPVTLTNGLTFGTNTAHLTSGWTPYAVITDTDVRNKVPDLSSAPPADVSFSSLMRSYFSFNPPVANLNIPGLTPGRTYRLQLISVDPQGCGVTIEGLYYQWPGPVPSVLAFTWVAQDTAANVVIRRRVLVDTTFTGYALHDVTDSMPFVDITNVLGGVTNVPLDTTNFAIAGTNSALTVGDVWWTVTNLLDGSSTGGVGVGSADIRSWTFDVPVTTGENVIVISGTNAVGTGITDSATVNVIPEPAMLCMVGVLGALAVLRKRG